MTIDKTLKVQRGMVRSRSVLSRAERIQRLKEVERWAEGDSPLGLAKVRVYKLAMKKKKKKKEEGEEGAEGAAAAPAAAGAGAAGAKPAAGKPAAAKAAAAPAKPAAGAKPGGKK